MMVSYGLLCWEGGISYTLSVCMSQTSHEHALNDRLRKARFVSQRGSPEGLFRSDNDRDSDRYDFV